MTELWLKAFSWAKVGPAWSAKKSKATALQARPWASQASNCRVKLAATEVKVRSTVSPSRWATVALPPPAFSTAITLEGLRASKLATGEGVAAALGAGAGGLFGAGALAAGLAAAFEGALGAGLGAAAVARTAPATR